MPPFPVAETNGTISLYKNLAYLLRFVKRFLLFSNHNLTILRKTRNSVLDKVSHSILSQPIHIVFFLYLLPSAWEFAYASVENGQTSAACGIPMYFVQGSLMVGFALAAFRAAQGVWSNLRTLLQKGDE